MKVTSGKRAVGSVVLVTLCIVAVTYVTQLHDQQLKESQFPTTGFPDTEVPEETEKTEDQKTQETVEKLIKDQHIQNLTLSGEEPTNFTDHLAYETTKEHHESTFSGDIRDQEITPDGALNPGYGSRRRTGDGFGLGKSGGVPAPEGVTEVHEDDVEANGLTVKDLLDLKAKKAEYYVSQDGCSSEAQWAINFEAHKNHGRQCLHRNATQTKNAVRCCAKDGLSCYSENSKTECYGTAKTHDEAEAICDADGKRLCTGEELEGNICCKSGCMYDLKVAWTSDKCSGSTVHTNESYYVPGDYKLDNSTYDFDLTTTYQWCGYRGVRQGRSECEEPTQPCPTECGHDAAEFYGRMFCETIVGQKKVDPKFCRFPMTPAHVKKCPSTQACLEYATETPKEIGQTCPSKCGFEGSVLEGRLKCLDSKTKEEVPAKKCEYWKLKKPTIPTQTCPVTPACVAYKAPSPKELGKTCTTTCGFPGAVLKGRVFCEEVVSGKEVSDAKCNFWNHPKPDLKTQTCAATPACVHYIVKTPSELGKACTETCGFGGSVLDGSVTCHEKVSGSAVGDAKCSYWDIKKPLLPTKKCDPTPACVEYVRKTPTEVGLKCDTSCGAKGSTLTGTVKCTETVSGKAVKDSECSHWDLKKPSAPTLTCDTMPACVKWATAKPTETCETTCGAAAKTWHGKSFCQEEVSGATVSDSKCFFDGDGTSSLGSKPTTPTKDCPATEICAKWVTVKPTDACTTTCGFDGDNKTGSVHCAAQIDNSQVSDSICNFWSLKKPTTPTKKCPAQESCRRFGVETPAEQGQTCSKKCGHPAYTLTGSVTCCKAGPGGQSYDGNTECETATQRDKCHDSWANAELANKPDAPTETCDAAAECVSFVETSAPACATSCGVEAETKKGTVTCHETKSQELVADSQCFAQNLTKPEVMVRECDATAACPTRNPTAAPTTPTSAPTHAKRTVKIKFIGEGSDTGDCREDWSSEMVMATTFTLGDRSKISQCDYFQCNTDSWCSKELNSMSGDSTGGWKTYTVQPESNGDIPLKFTLEAFEADSSGDSTWKNCVYESGDDCKATIEGSHTFRINSDYFVTSDGKASGSATTKLQGSSSGHYGNWKMKAQWEIS